MITPVWMICERSTRWAAALRMAITRRMSDSERAAPIYEVRSLPDLTNQLKQHPSSLVLIEITSKNLEAALTWLGDMVRGPIRIPVVALLDFRRTDNPVCTSFPNDGHNGPSVDRQQLCSALREAGAIDILDSPRQIKLVLTIAERHASNSIPVKSSRREADQSFTDWAWSLLPWQEAKRPLG